MNFFKKTYTKSLRKHYEDYFGVKGLKCKWDKGPKNKLNSEFFILEMPPNKVHKMWTYLTVGMSLDHEGQNPIELFVFSPVQDSSLIELMTVNASFHRNSHRLDLHHTVNIGRPWLNDSKCDHGFISLPYLDGDELLEFSFNEKIVRIYWFIPITEKERDYKIENGYETLEKMFEEHRIDFLKPDRKCTVLME